MGAQGIYENVKKGSFSNKSILQGKIQLLLPDYSIRLVDLHLTTVC